jgi:hypothetical protein
MAEKTNNLLSLWLNNEVAVDLKDCLQTECAKAVNVDYIVTRNVEDFTGSSVPAVLPEDFLEKMGENETEQ